MEERVCAVARWLRSLADNHSVVSSRLTSGRPFAQAYMSTLLTPPVDPSKLDALLVITSLRTAVNPTAEKRRGVFVSKLHLNDITSLFEKIRQMPFW